MDALQHVGQVAKIDALIEVKRGELEHLRSLASRLSSPVLGERVGGGCASGDALPSAVAAIQEKEQELTALVDYYLAKRSAVLRDVERLEDPVAVQVIYRRHFQRQTWERIAVDLGYTYQWVIELHKRGMSRLSEILDRT